MSNYTLDYFIEKFEAIPGENWCVGAFTNPIYPDKHCVMGHCGVTRWDDPIFGFSGEAGALRDIFRAVGLSPTKVNDNDIEHFFEGETPKGRILTVLRKIKSGWQL